MQDMIHSSSSSSSSFSSLPFDFFASSRLFHEQDDDDEDDEVDANDKVRSTGAFKSPLLLCHVCCTHGEVTQSMKFKLVCNRFCSIRRPISSYKVAY